MGDRHFKTTAVNASIVCSSVSLIVISVGSKCGLTERRGCKLFQTHMFPRTHKHENT
eukprot:m.204744 g.204744  ORF g.204744 m.204744 type:complete len:57 (+) comp18871_c0_seq61:1265-1435(+)